MQDAPNWLACFAPDSVSIVFSRNFAFDYRKYRNTMVHEMCHYYLYSFAPADGASVSIEHGKAFQELVDKLNAEHRELNVMLKDCDYLGD